MTQQPSSAPPIPRWIKIFAIGSLGLLVLTVLLVIIGNVTASATPEPSAAASPSRPAVATADASIRGVADSAEYFVVDMKPEAWGDGDRLFAAGSVAQAVGRALQQGASDGGAAPTVLVTITADLVDRLGREREQIVLSVFFDRADLLAANFDNLSVGRTLNLATDVRFDRHGAQAILEYCLTDRGREQSRPFCALAESKVPA